MPEVTTIAEAGLPGYEARSWYGLMLPAATPAAIVERLSGETAKAVESAELKERLISQGIEPVAGGAVAFSRYLRAEIPKWAKVIKDARIPAQ